MPDVAEGKEPVTSERAHLAAILVAAAGAASLLLLTMAVGQQSAGSVGLLFAYQALAWFIVLAVVSMMRRLVGRPFRYLRFGEPSAPARAMRVLAVKTGESWLRVGSIFAVVTTAATAAWLVLNVGLSTLPLSQWLSALMIAIPLSVSNAAVEEIVTRWTLAEGLTGQAARFAPGASSAIFGAVHYFGIPGGWSGAAMAAFLGWLLTRSIQDTGGLFWAVLVHACIDLVIFTLVLSGMA